MPLTLRLKRRRPDGTPGVITSTVPLDPEFYDLDDLIDMIDECVYHGCDVALLTADHDAFPLDPRRYSAISVLRED